MGTVGSYFMTTEEELAAKGRILNDYVQAKTRLATLEGTARTVISQLNVIIQQVTNFEAAPVNLALGLPTTQELQKLVADLQETSRQKRLLAQKLQELGASVSDR
jgi:Tfp pilus assembly protein PilO